MSLTPLEIQAAKKGTLGAVLWDGENPLWGKMIKGKRVY